MAPQAEFFKIISPCRESWLAAYRDLDKFKYDKLPQHFSVLHLAARWGISAIVEHVFFTYDQYDTAEGSIHLTDVSYDEPLEPAATTNWGKGRSPLHWASENGHVEVVKLFLEHKTHPLSVISGATKLTADIDHMTALHYTVSNASEEMAQYFLDAGISINTGVRRRIWSEARCVSHDSDDFVVDCSSRRGLTALHYAALMGSKRMTKFLLDRGANPNVVSEHGETPLHLALKRNLCGPRWPAAADRWNDPVYRIEQALDNIGYDPKDEDEFGKTWDLIEQHRLSVLTLLLNKDSTDVNAKDMYGASPLHCVMFENIKAPNIIELLIERGADVSARNDQGQTALHLACLQGSLCSVIVLVNRGSDVTTVDLQGLNAIHYAAQSRNTDLVEHMINLCPITLVAARDKRGRNALHHLVRQAWHVDVDAIEYLVSAGASVEDLDNKGLSPLALYLTDVMPLLSGAGGAVGLLLQHGSDPLFQTVDKGLNLAHLHANKSSKINIEVLETLRVFGVGLEEKDNEDRTLLHHCAIGGSLTKSALQFLCDEVGLDKDVQDTHGKVPLQYATEQRRKKRDPNTFDSDRWLRTEKILLGAPWAICILSSRVKYAALPS
ncbi:hypothetical protein MY10362_005905 [Beauveria mimosiformis]